MSHIREQFARTTCACVDCKACCKRQPGPLVMGDFERIVAWREEQGFDHDLAVEWVKSKLWASPGALVKTRDGQTYRVGTITPRYRKGRCVFLDENDRCKIHSVAPFGCSHFDTHMGNAQAIPRSLAAVDSACDPEYQKLRDTLPMASHYKPSPYR